MERFLNRSVESLLATDYENKEIILVNDGSSDSTRQLIDSYCSMHQCIKGIHKPNGGVASARNAGLDVVAGKYVVFVDPDDYVDTDYISTAVRKAEDKQCDILLMGYSTPWFSNPPVWRDYPPIEDYECRSNAEIISKVFPRFFGMSSERLARWISGDQTWQNDKELPAVCRAMFRSDFIKCNGLKFRNLKVGEDSIFLYESMICADSLSTVRSCSYKYEPLQQGAIVSTLKPENILRNKRILHCEMIRIATKLEKIHGRSFLDHYAGSIVIGAIQVADSICDNHPYKVWKEYLNSIDIKRASNCVSVHLQGGGVFKRAFPVWLIKKHQYRLLYFLLKVAHRLKISANEWG